MPRRQSAGPELGFLQKVPPRGGITPAPACEADSAPPRTRPVNGVVVRTGDPIGEQHGGGITTLSSIRTLPIRHDEMNGRPVPLQVSAQRRPDSHPPHGGWTDTWFAGHGKVFNIAVSPYVEVQIKVHPIGSCPPLVLDAKNYGERYTLSLPSCRIAIRCWRQP